MDCNQEGIDLESQISTQIKDGHVIDKEISHKDQEGSGTTVINVVNKFITYCY